MTTRSKRRRFRFSLRTLLIVMLLLSVGLGWFGLREWETHFISFLSVPCWFLTAMFLLCRCFWQYDKVLKRIYENSPDVWRELGQPLGFFWVPKGASTMRLASTTSRSCLLGRLISKADVKIEGCPDLTGDQSVMRQTYFYYKVCFVLMFIDVVCCAVLVRVLWN